MSAQAILSQSQQLCFLAATRDSPKGKEVKQNRRQVLLGIGFAPFATPSFAERDHSVLRAGEAKLAVNGSTMDMLGFNNTVPGPEIRIKQNDTLMVRLENALDEGTILHWHGIRLPNAMDGVNVLTQDAVNPSAGFDYAFEVPDAGTFWYHSHYLSLEQVSRGMFGPLIVEELDPPDVDQDITIQVFDVLSDGQGGFDREYYASHFVTSGRIGDVVMAFSSSTNAKYGHRLRLRLINPSVDRVFRLRIEGLRGSVVALDGMPLRQIRSLTEMTLAPGQRADVIGDVLDDVVLTEVSTAKPRELTRIAASGARELRHSEILPLPRSNLPTPGKIRHRVPIVMQGGAGAAPHRSFGTWALNDMSGLPRTPILSARRGSTVVLELRNETNFAHGIHLHGHHFWETDANGKATILRDTTLVDPGDTRKVICVLDNPGAWLVHCHMLSHQEDGMATWLVVT